MSTASWNTLLDRLGETTGRRPRGTADTVACRCPAHPDKNPSLSARLCPDGRILLRCFAGCSVESIAASVGMEMKDLMPDDTGTGSKAPVRRVRSDKLPILPDDLCEGTEADRQKLSRLRNLNIESVHIAVERGLIRFGTYKGARCWFITDGTLRNVQARRLDGERFGDLKALTLRDSRASWPIGIMAVQAHQSIALVEGGPDLLAALSLAWAEGSEQLVAPVAMLGAAHSIPDDALSLFRGKRVRIFPHLDEAGQKAAPRWEQQLAAAGATVRCISLKNIRTADGTPAKDLNDVCRVHPDDFERDRSLWNLFEFAREVKS